MARTPAVSADTTEPTMSPVSTSRTLSSWPDDEEYKIRAKVPSAPISPGSVTPNCAHPAALEATTPSAAPADTPSRPGSASGFPVTKRMRTPATASRAPAATAPRALGRRRFTISRWDRRSGSPNSAATACPALTPPRPRTICMTTATATATAHTASRSSVLERYGVLMVLMRESFSVRSAGPARR